MRFLMTVIIASLCISLYWNGGHPAWAWGRLQRHHAGSDHLGSARPIGRAALNFATFGTLVATFASGETRTCDSLRIAQGHRSAAPLGGT